MSVAKLAGGIPTKQSLTFDIYLSNIRQISKNILHIFRKRHTYYIAKKTTKGYPHGVKICERFTCKTSQKIVLRSFSPQQKTLTTLATLARHFLVECDMPANKDKPGWQLSLHNGIAHCCLRFNRW